MENEELNLTEYLAQDGQPEGFDERTFIINDDAQAIWAMRNFAVAQKRIDEVESQGADEISRLTKWVELATKPSRTTATYFSEALESYMLRLRDDGRKSLLLPDGEVSSRATSSKASVVDSEAFLEWARANDRREWMRVTIAPNLAALKGVVDFIDDSVIDNETGEFIPGLSHIEGGVSVSIKIAGL